MSVWSGRRVLVTGGAGFIGSNLCDRLAGLGARVTVFDSLARAGVEANLDWLVSRHGRRVEARIEDVRRPEALEDAASGADAVFHLAAQVAVTTSLQDPRTDLEINVVGALNLIEAVRRRCPEAPVVFASTNKVYGDLSDIPLELGEAGWAPAEADPRRRGVDETRPLDFHTPYGCSKGAADQYILDASRSFGLRTSVLRMSCVYGPRQFGTEDQGWVAHFLIQALRRAPITIFGDGRQVRDVLYVTDAVDAYLAAAERMDAARGRAFNLGGGPQNAVSLLALIGEIEGRLGRPVELSFEPWRPGDQKYFVADAGRARSALGLRAPKPWREGLGLLADWLERDGGALSKAREAAA